MIHPNRSIIFTGNLYINCRSFFQLSFNINSNISSIKFIKKYIFLFALLFSLASESSFSQNNSNIIPDISEFVVKQRLCELNKSTPIQLDYNESVQAYIDVYTKKRREHLAKIIGRSEYYFPLFESYLDKHNLPLELKYLAIVESALDPVAKSSSGAMGLWQFLYGAAKMFDLNISTYIDERCDPIKSTEAACNYLKYLYYNFNDWQLALAAYNVGPGEVKKAIIRSGGKTDFWELKEYLPESAQGYVPAFIAANYVMNTYNLYDIEPVKFKYSRSDIDTVYLKKSITFENIGNITGLSLDDIKTLNPMYIKEYIPVTNYQKLIYLPCYLIPRFISEVESIPERNQVHKNSNKDTSKLIKNIHIVEKGEYCHKIAMKYRCTVEDILNWNNLDNKDLSEGQRLVVYVLPPPNKFFFIAEEPVNKRKKQTEFLTKGSE